MEERKYPQSSQRGSWCSVFERGCQYFIQHCPCPCLRDGGTLHRYTLTSQERGAGRRALFPPGEELTKQKGREAGHSECHHLSASQRLSLKWVAGCPASSLKAQQLPCFYCKSRFSSQWKQNLIESLVSSVLGDS